MERIVELEPPTLLDLDHVVTRDGCIHRVVGNLDSGTHFFGYNVYSPDIHGDRLYKGQPYKKHFTEDSNLPADVLDTYTMIPIEDIAEHHDPVQSARTNSESFCSTVWFDLYAELVRTFGIESVGIFGSSMFGLHLTPDGNVRKDVDFVIQGLDNVELLRQRLPAIRAQLGFSAVTAERQLRQYDRYRRLFRNDNNSIQSIIARRWTGMQLSEDVVTTIRFREPALKTSLDIVTPSVDDHDVILSGCVVDAGGSNLFPRTFRLLSADGPADICILWWKFSTPVRDGDTVTLRGSLLRTHRSTVIRLTNYSQHWLRIEG